MGLFGGGGLSFGPFDFGNTIGGTMLGVGSEAENLSGQASGKTFDMAEQYWDETAPVRSGVIDRMAKFVNGGFDPAQSPLYAAQKKAIEEQYGTAMDNLLARLPGGGALNEGITGLEVGRANSLIDALAQIFNQEYTAALDMANASPGTTFQGMGTGGNINAPVIGGQAQKQSANMNAFGNIISSIFG